MRFILWTVNFSALKAGKHLSDHGVAKKLLKLGLNQWQNGVVALGRLAGVIDFPVPPNSSMRKTGGRNIGGYYVGGLKTSLPIMTCMRLEGVALDQKIRVLDFGCGVARPLLHFTKEFPAPSYYACDIDDSAVEFVRKNYAQVRTSVTRFTPPLPYESGFFDAIYSVSIFSHLSLEDQTLWLNELARVTRPGGFCFLTTSGPFHVPFRCHGVGMTESEMRAQLERDGFYYKEYDNWQESVKTQHRFKVTSLLVGVERSYGVTMVTPGHIRKHWPAAGFEVRAVVEGCVDGQDLVILRRSSP